MPALSRIANHPVRSSLVAALLTAAAFLVFPISSSHAAAPANDTCSAPVPLTLGTVVDADSTQAADNYQATTISDTATVLAPSAGPDLVYTLTLTGTETAQVFVAAPFNVSLYAASNSPLTPTTPCGKSQFPAATAQNQIGLFPFFPPGTTETVWSIVVDGWTAADAGPMEVGTTVGGGCPFTCEAIAIGGLDQASASLGSTLTDLKSKSTRWSFAESSTRGGLREFITLSSPTTQDVTITYNLDPSSPGFGGVNPVVRTVHLVAGQRSTVVANDAANGGAGPDLDFSFLVEGASSFDASAALYVNRDIGLGSVSVGFTNIQGESN